MYTDMSSKCTALVQVISILLLLFQSVVIYPSPLHNEDIQEPTPNNPDGHPDVKPCGEGLFRDPLEILGDKFTEARIIHLCKADVYMFADVISDVIFMPFGVKMCRSVCDGYQENMNIDVTVNVSLINSNCDYTGSTTIVEHSGNCTHAATCPDLSIACVCYYNVRCDRRTKCVKFEFNDKPLFTKNDSIGGNETNANYTYSELGREYRRKCSFVKSSSTVLANVTPEPGTEEQLWSPDNPVDKSSNKGNDWSEYEVLLPAANLLLLNDVNEACCEFLQKQLQPRFCLGIKAFANVHSCTKLLTSSDSTFNKTFQKLLKVANSYSYQKKKYSISSDELAILCEEKLS